MHRPNLILKVILSRTVRKFLICLSVPYKAFQGLVLCNNLNMDKNVSNLSVVMSIRQFCPTSWDGWMMTDLLRYSLSSLTYSNVSLWMKWTCAHERCMDSTYEHRNEWSGYTPDCRRIIRYLECSDRCYLPLRVSWASNDVDCHTVSQGHQQSTKGDTYDTRQTSGKMEVAIIATSSNNSCYDKNTIYEQVPSMVATSRGHIV
jgi:hypothetical protein